MQKALQEVREAEVLPQQPQPDQLQNAKKIIGELTFKLLSKESELQLANDSLAHKSKECEELLKAKEAESKGLREALGVAQKESRERLGKKQSELKGLLEQVQKLKGVQSAQRGQITKHLNDMKNYKASVQQKQLKTNKLLSSLKARLVTLKLNSLRLSFLRSLFSSIQLKTSKECSKSKADLALRVGEVAQLTALSKDQKSKLGELTKSLQANAAKLTQTEGKAAQFQKNLLILTQSSEIFKKQAQRKQKDLLSQIGVIKKNLLATREEQSLKESEHFERQFKIHEKYREDIIKLKQGFSRQFGQLKASIASDLSAPLDLQAKLKEIQKITPEAFPKISEALDSIKKEVRRSQAKELELQVLNKMYLLKLEEVLNGRAMEQDSQVTF